jgi:hypothetical protein
LKINSNPSQDQRQNGKPRPQPIVGKVELRKRIHHEFSHLKELETTIALKLSHDSQMRATLT